MELQGKIKVLNETQTFDSGFRKRELVLTTEEQYPQDISIEFVQDKVDVLNDYNINDRVKIGINLRGREWVNPEGVSRYFNSVVGWRIENSDTHDMPSVPPVDMSKDDNPDNDLPF